MRPQQIAPPQPDARRAAVHVCEKRFEAVAGRVGRLSTARSRLPDIAQPVCDAELAALIVAARMVHGPPMAVRSVVTGHLVTRQMSRLHGRPIMPASDLGSIFRAALAGAHATVRTQ